MLVSQIQETFHELIDKPDERFQKFFSFYCDVKLNASFSIDKYLRSGREMIRMANIYLKEQDYFYAFVLYSRYTILYLEKIKSHPQFASADKSELAEINRQVKSLALPQAEKLKVYIKDTFAREAREYAAQVAESASRQQAASSTSGGRDNEPMDYEALKRKYNNLNESELRELLEKERQSAKTETDGAPEPSAPSFDRALKPQTSTPSNRYNLRTVIVPSDCSRKFLDVAEANTSRNVETCGILAGKLTQNKFILTHCILPKQKGTSDTCSTEQEHELLNIIDNYNLITLGWIHTHPSQTAFLSSIDLHTHFGYQIMLPESIAIVCAPSYDQVGMFILSPDRGLKEIGDCNISGFHPHTKTPPLFEECDHVVLDNKYNISIVDLRIVSSKTY